MSAPGPMLHFLVSNLNGKVLDVAGGRGVAGAKVILYPKHDPPQKNQLWFAEDCGNGYFHLVTESNRSLVMDVEGEDSSPGTDICVWNKKYPPAQNQMFRWQGQCIVSAMGSHLALDIENGKGEDGAQITIYNYHGGPNQCFRPENVPVVCHLVTSLNGKVLDVYGGQGNPGSKVVIYSKNYPPSKNQLFYTEDCGGGWFFIVPECNRNCVLDVEREESRAGAKICIWNRKSPPANNQKFRWQGNTIISALGHNLALDIDGGNGHDGDRIILWDRHGNANQCWQVVHP